MIWYDYHAFTRLCTFTNNYKIYQQTHQFLTFIVCHNLWHYFIDLELRWFNNRLPWKQLYFMLVGVRGQIQNKLSAKSKRKSYGIFFLFIELCVFISSKFLFLRYYQVIAFHFVKKVNSICGCWLIYYQH